MNRKKRIFSLFIICAVCIFTAACGPSEEKVMQAQQKYTELKEKHNQVVEIHGNISDSTYDEQLLALRGKIDEVEAYNLNDMKDEEIDLLIQIMDSLIDSYDEFHTVLTDIKAKEEAAVIVTIPVTVVNNTGIAISSVKLHEQGDYHTQVNVLENMTSLESGQTLTGLMIQRDVDNTPWILTIECVQNAEETAGLKAELQLSVEEYEESGETFILIYDEETEAIIIAAEAETTEETVEE